MISMAHFSQIKNVYQMCISCELNTFKATIYSSWQIIIYVKDEYKIVLKVFKSKNNALLAIASNGIIFEKFQPIGVELLRNTLKYIKKYFLPMR